MDILKRKNPWELRKLVLPQNTDHAGVLWHGAYLNFLEEGRISALNSVGIPYSEISAKGIEMPVILLNISYKLPVKHGEEILLKTWFTFSKGPKIKCLSHFIKSGNLIATEAIAELVIVSNIKGRNRIMRNFPLKLKGALEKLNYGPKTII